MLYKHTRMKAHEITEVTAELKSDNVQHSNNVGCFRTDGHRNWKHCHIGLYKN